MSDNLASIFRRIKKLLAIANDNRADPNEAAAAASQAEKIMRKYQIEESEIISAELKEGKDETFGETDCEANLYGTSRTDSTLSMLAVPIARLNDAQALIITDPIIGKVIRFRGYKPDMEVCRFTFRYVLNHMRAAAKLSGIRSTNTRSFYQGYVAAIIEMLNTAIAEKKAEMQKPQGGYALVIVKSDAVTKHFGEQNYTKRRVDVKNEDVYNKGQAEGRKLDIFRRGVNTNLNNTVLIK